MTCAFDTAAFSTKHIIWRINQQLERIILGGVSKVEHWKGVRVLHPLLAGRRPKRRITRASKICWAVPRPNCMKVNTDGAYSATRYIAGGGGVIRDADGRLIFTFSDSFAALSSLEAEFKAFEQGIIAAVRFGNNIWMETDATSIVRIITSEEQVPAEIRHSIRRIKHLCKGLNIMVSYIAREGNKPADFLAERGLEEQGRSNFDHITAPARLKVMVEMEANRVPNFRFQSRWSEE
ncbi:uncharacterized protein LOC121752853 [Salvia splendens]|uniref:uncharacterized protein LOC121752853 n=1 Tax=Salvia splendens TaxID=180675 RepID=UPI001C257C30|nr:uncharacterized protein LOC121752853 [Salvia splendens]